VGHPVQPPAEAGSPRAGCTGPCPGRSGISPEKETPQPLWAACSRAPSPSEGKKFFLRFRQNMKTTCGRTLRPWDRFPPRCFSSLSPPLVSVLPSLRFQELQVSLWRCPTFSGWCHDSAQPTVGSLAAHLAACPSTHQHGGCCPCSSSDTREPQQLKRWGPVFPTADGLLESQCWGKVLHPGVLLSLPGTAGLPCWLPSKASGWSHCRLQRCPYPLVHPICKTVL